MSRIITNAKLPRRGCCSVFILILHETQSLLFCLPCQRGARNKHVWGVFMDPARVSFVWDNMVLWQLRMECFILTGTHDVCINVCFFLIKTVQRLLYAVWALFLGVCMNLEIDRSSSYCFCLFCIMHCWDARALCFQLIKVVHSCQVMPVALV